MDKAQAIDRFWNSFDLPAYDENSVPDDAKMPYITYSLTVDNLDSPVTLSGNLWYRSESWKDITLKSEEISKKVSEKGILKKPRCSNLNTQTARSGDNLCQ